MSRFINDQEDVKSQDIISNLNKVIPQEKGYVLVTLHRPSNVDRKAAFSGFVDVLETTSRDLPVVWPVHPRSRGRAQELGLWERLQDIKDLHLTEPVGYLDNVNLMSGARLVLTDSGGIQEETTALGVPCLTARANTERPVTISEGTNRLVGTDRDEILEHVKEHVQNGAAGSTELPRPLYWDGQTAGRIVEALLAVNR